MLCSLPSLQHLERRMAHSRHAVNICQMNRTHRSKNSFRAGEGFAQNLTARKWTPRSDAFHYDSLQFQFSKKILICDHRAGDFYYLCLSAFFGKALLRYELDLGWGGVQGVRAAKAFLPQSRHTMNTLFYREKITFHHVFTHIRSVSVFLSIQGTHILVTFLD